MKNNIKSECFLKNVECLLTFLKSDKEFNLSDEMSEQDNYSAIVINKSFIKVHEILKILNVFNVNQDESVDNDVYLK